MALHAALTALPSEQRTPCVRGVVRMMATEQSCEECWRVTQVRRDGDADGEAAVAKCFSTLRAEGVVVRVRTGGPQTYYRLDRRHASLIETVERHGARLDDHHAGLLDGLDQGFGTLTA